MHFRLQPLCPPHLKELHIHRNLSPSIPTETFPPSKGKVILVTGGTDGLGKQCVLEYTKHNPALIWLVARNPAKAQAAIEEIQSRLPRPIAANIKPLELDLSSFESVQKAASIVLAECQRLDVLMLNAGIMAVPPGFITNGHEIQFGTNYLGHILLIVRDGHSLGPYERYGQSKLAMILWAKEAARRYPQITVVSVHPGVVRTNLMDNATGSPYWEQGVRNQLWASVSANVVSGCYYEPVGIGGLEREIAKDDNLARGL
ncbi:hypothetical protein BDV11DRAFT_204758 [Aspergillus similis]